MVAFRIGDLRVTTLDDEAFASVLEAAALAGGAPSFPTLFGLMDADREVEPLALVDELARLGSAQAGRRVALLVGTLRDDLMTALAAADEG
jgi:hypothetical protein